MLGRASGLVAFLAGMITASMLFSTFLGYRRLLPPIQLGPRTLAPTPPLPAAAHRSVLKPEWRITPDMKGRFFVYQTSGGFGNQRLIIQWAITAANAMNRTLVLPMIAPHSQGWLGNWNTKASDSASMNRLLDLETLERVVNCGIKVHEDTLSSLFNVVGQEVFRLPRKGKVRSAYLGTRSWEVFHWNRETRANFNSADKIRKKWLNNPADVVYWEKSSMWICCSSPLVSWYRRHVTFNRDLKRLVIKLIKPMGAFNAVHVRRGDKPVSDLAEILERKTPMMYYKYHHLDRFNKSLPLYVATDEPVVREAWKEHSWFDDWRESRGAPEGFRDGSFVFWQDLDVGSIERAVALYPPAMRGDVLGFIEQLICANAVRWEGSRTSTFSISIKDLRKSPAGASLDFVLPPRPTQKAW